MAGQHATMYVQWQIQWGGGEGGNRPPQTKINIYFKHNTNKTHNNTDFYNQNVCLQNSLKGIIQKWWCWHRNE